MIDQILQQQGGFYGAEKTGKNDVLGKDAFLKLLVTQLKHQDPLNPLDDKEFIAQLAQFSSLEQMTNISEGITALTEKTAQQDMLSSVNYIGKNVTASGNEVTKYESVMTPLYFSLDEAASVVYANVYDMNNNLVHTEKMSGMQKGDYEYRWDATDYNGKNVANGQYKVYFSAENANGKPVFINSEVSGTIIGLEQSSTGLLFRLSDGRTIGFGDVKKVVQPVNTSGSNGTANGVTGENE
ncbi:flagellar hook assembly protein FlgD [Desulfovibrionales bacterium]